ncbi:hypothetical protein CULT_1560005 [[Clostridium] ultunense Esp]|nr:hypothetical protein CULT_1560005 [[Clostridium] ultunense Esp]
MLMSKKMNKILRVNFKIILTPKRIISTMILLKLFIYCKQKVYQ